MTSEERRRLMKKMVSQNDNEEKAQQEALEIEAPQDTVYTVNDASARRQLMKQLVNSSTTETNFSKGVALADQQWKSISNISDRKELTNYYDAYMQDLQRARENNDEVNYERDTMLLNRIAEKLGKQANVGTFLQDTSAEIGGNIRGNIADVARNVEKAYLELRPKENLDADVLYNIATRQPGTLKDVIGNYGWGKDEWRELVLLKNEYPDDNIIKDLYDTVSKQGYTRDKEYFETVVKYINNKSHTDAYNNSTIVRNTQDEKNFMQSQKLKEELTYQEPIDKPDIMGAAKTTLSGIGTAAYMAPSAAMAYVGAGVGEAFNLTKAGISTAARIGSLSEMYMAAAGNAFDTALNEGYEWDKSSKYSKLIGSLEVVTELIGGENVNAFLFGGTVGKTALSPVISKLIEKGGSDLARFMISVVTDVAAEAMEEVISALIEPILDLSVLGRDTTIDDYWDGVLEAAYSSVVPTLIMGGYGKVQTIDAVNKTEKELLRMVEQYRGEAKEFFSDDELNRLEEKIKEWSNRAKAGISEHYDDIKGETENYEDVMEEIYGTLNTRPIASMSIAEYAQTLDDLEPEARERAIIDYAERQGISEQNLRKMFADYPQMFPYTSQQYQNYQATRNNLSSLQGQVQNQANQANQLGSIMGAFNSMQGATLIPPANYKGNLYDWLKQSRQEITNNGISKIELDENAPDIKNDAIYGTYNANNKLAKNELNNAPVALHIMDILNIDNPPIERGYYVYKNLNDALKDIKNNFGSLDQFEFDSGGEYEILSLAGKGKYDLIIDYDNPDDPLMEWLPPKKKQTQQPVNPKPANPKRPIKAPNNQPKGKFKRKGNEAQQPAPQPMVSNDLTQLANKYGALQTTTINGRNIEYVEVTRSGKKSPFAEYFKYYNPENDGKTFKDTTQEELNKEPVVAVFTGNRGNTLAFIFKNVQDLRDYYNNNFIHLVLARNATSKGMFQLWRENGDWVWRSDLTGKKVKYENAPATQISPVGKSLSAFLKPLEPVRHIDFRGETFSNVAELADIMQKAIDPSGETSRFIFTKKIGKKEEIVGQETVTNNLFAAVKAENNKDIMADYLTNKAKAIGADYIYSVHNHPDHSTPSGRGNDISFSRTYKDKISKSAKIIGAKVKWGGSLVEGANNFTFWGSNRKGFEATKNGKRFVQTPYQNGYKFDGYKNEKWVKEKVQDIQSLKKVASELQDENGYSKIVMLDYDWHPRAIVNVNDDALKASDSIINTLLYDLSLEFTGGIVGVVTDNQDVYNSMCKSGVRVVFVANQSTNKSIDRSHHKDLDPYLIGKGDMALRSKSVYLTPADEQVDNDDYIGRDSKPKEEKKEQKKEPRHRLSKKSNTFAEKVLEEYSRRTNVNQETKKEVSENTKVMKDLIPTDMEKKMTSTEKAIRAIENGEKERELNRARSTLADMRRYIREVMKGRMGILKGPAARKAYGIWKGQTHWIRASQLSNVSTWFHEFGHEINGTVLNMKALREAFKNNPEMEEHFNKLCEEAFGKEYDKEPTKKLMEGFAEAVRRYVENPEGFTEDYEDIALLFANEAENNKAFAEMFAHMKVLSEMVKDYVNDTPEGRVLGNVDMHGEGEKPVYAENTLQRFVTKAVEQLFNDMTYATKFDRMRAKLKGKKYTSLLSSEKLEDMLRIKGNAMSIKTQLATGMYDDYGNKITKGLSEIMEDFLPTNEEAKSMGMSLKDARVKRVEDLVAYGIAVRELSLIENRSEDLMLGSRYNDLLAVKNKFKNDAKLNKAMEDINENSKALIDLAVEKGLIKYETGQQILQDNVMYFPLNRVMEESAPTKLGRSLNGSTGKSFYRLKGSDLQISNPLISLMGNWGRIIYQIEHNDILQNLVSFIKENEELGIWADFGVMPKMSFKGQVPMDVFKSAIENELDVVGKHLGVNIPASTIVDNMDFNEVYNLFVPEAGDASQRMLTYLENGTRKTVQFANNELGRGLYSLIANLDVQKGGTFLKLMNAINMPLKVGATAWNVEFALSNIQSDALQRFLYSNGTALYIPIVTSMYNVARYMNSRYAEKLPWDNENAASLYEKFMRSGASQDGTYRGEQLWLRDNMEDVFGYAEDVLFGKKKNLTFEDFRKKVGAKVGSVGQKLNYLSEVSEQATRFAEFVMVYKQMKAKGGFTEAQCIKEAGMKARQVTQDFTVQGKFMRELNKMVPFASATVGGLYRFGVEARNHPVRLAGRLTVLAAVASFIEGMMDGEDREYYEEINKQKRFDNFFFPNPEDKQHPFIIKKPQGPARYMINLAQLMTNVALGRIEEDKVVDELYDWLTRSVDDQLPVTKVEDLLPGGLQAFVENAVNKDFYYGTPIVSKDLEKLDPRNQYDEYTSEVAKAIGNVFNWSPVKIDNVLKTWFAGLGKQVLGIIDEGVDFFNGEDDIEIPSRDKSESFPTSKIFANAFRSSESINEIYDRYEKLQTEEAEGRLTDDELREYSDLQDAKNALSKLNKEIEAVRTSGKYSADEKAEKINVLREERIDVARYYLGKSLLNESNKKKVQKYGYYPANETYTYTYKKQKYEVKFDEKLQEEYATEFQKTYEEELKKLKETQAYKTSTEQEKLELEKKTKTAARTATTNKMKKVAYERQYGK